MKITEEHIKAITDRPQPFVKVHYDTHVHAMHCGIWLAAVHWLLDHHAIVGVVAVAAVGMGIVADRIMRRV